MAGNVPLASELRNSSSTRSAAAAALREVELALDENREQRQRRIRKLFALFDASGSGFVDHGQIEDRFKSMAIPFHYKYAQELLRVCDANNDGRVDFQEFTRYIDEKEVELYHMFQQIDATNDGIIEPDELREALFRAGIHISDKELSRFVDHVDRDNNGIITFQEWRDFLLLFPDARSITDIYQYWEKVCQVDIGEQAVIPEGISRQLHASKYFIAGGVAGAVSRTATAPLDRLKVILQVQTHITGRVSLLQGLKQIYAQGGMLAYFVGNGINILKVAPESAVKFYAFEMLKELSSKLEGQESKAQVGTLGRLLSGGTAGAIAQTVVYPMDVVKTRLQVHPGKPKTLMSFVRDIYVQEGPRALYRGLVPSLIGIVPYAGIDLATYETLKDLSKSYRNTEPGPWTQLACGTISGAFGATCVYPLQLIRTRLQAQSLNSSARYTGMVDVFRQTLQKEGFAGFYKGIVPNLFKVAPAASITYVVYEKMKKLLAIS